MYLSKCYFHDRPHPRRAEKSTGGRRGAAGGHLHPCARHTARSRPAIPPTSWGKQPGQPGLVPGLWSTGLVSAALRSCSANAVCMTHCRIGQIHLLASAYFKAKMIKWEPINSWPPSVHPLSVPFLYSLSLSLSLARALSLARSLS